jgi:hypothetical protein
MDDKGTTGNCWQSLQADRADGARACQPANPGQVGRGKLRLDNLHLTAAKGYVRSLLANARVVRWITQHRSEYLDEFRAIAEIDTVAPVQEAGE